MDLKLSSHEKYMAIAIAYAERNSGSTCPNPSVGCVIVKDGRIIAAAATSPSGRPHAEVNALNSAIEDVKGATAYVTLEPCSHHGKTPPCADAIINSGIAKVVISTADPNPLVAGQGIIRLRQAGIEVICGVLEAKGKKLHQAFFKRMHTGTPYITLKMAESIDGKIGFRNKKYVLSCEESRAYAHHLRAKNEAILVGVDTVINDDPMLNCRLPGLLDTSPVRIVLDSAFKIPEDSKIVTTADKYKTYIITVSDAERNLPNIEVIRVNPNKLGKVSLKEALLKLGEKGINSVVVEGGAKVASAFIRNKLVDRLEILTTPKILGANAVDGISIRSKKFEKDFKFIKCKRYGQDVLNVYERFKPL